MQSEAVSGTSWLGLVAFLLGNHLKRAPPNLVFTRRFAPHSHFALDPTGACYVVTLELPVPIDVVTLKASVHVELLDLDSNTSIVSRSPVESRHASSKDRIALLASFRCQDATNTLAFKVRTVEGEPGDLSVVVVSKTTPKSAHIVRFNVKALSLHRRTHDVSTL